MIMNKGSLHMTITRRYNDHLTNKLKTLSQTFIPLVIASISLLLQKSEWWRMEMTSQITLL